MFPLKIVGAHSRNTRTTVIAAVVAALVAATALLWYTPEIVQAESSGSTSYPRTKAVALADYQFACERDDGSPIRKLERAKAALDLVRWHGREDLRKEAAAIAQSYTPRQNANTKERCLANTLCSNLLPEQPLPYPVEDGGEQPQSPNSN